MSDLLRIDYINNLPQPFMVTLIGGSEWPVHDIEVETALFRIYVMGLLEVKSLSDVRFFTDESGVKHLPDAFYSDYESQQYDGQDLKALEAKA